MNNLPTPSEVDEIHYSIYGLSRETIAKAEGKRLSCLLLGRGRFSR